MKGKGIVVFALFYSLFAASVSAQETVYPDPGSGDSGRPDTRLLMEKFQKDEIEETAVIDPTTGAVVGGKMMIKTPEAGQRVLEMATAIANPTVAPNATPPHPFDMGAEPGAVVNNQIHDAEVILMPIRFWQCMDYRVLNPQGCYNPIKKKFTPYIKYHLPFQKVENVDQPFKAGYKDKTMIRGYRDALETALYGAAGWLAERQLFHAASFLQGQFGGSLQMQGVSGSDAQFLQKAVDDMVAPGSVFERKERRFRHQDGLGFVFNEYHVMPSLPLFPIVRDLIFFAFGLTEPSGAGLAHFLEYNQVLCHPGGKEIGEWYSDEVSRIIYARSWEPYLPTASSPLFPGLFDEKMNSPRSCQAFNISPPIRREIGFSQTPSYDPYGYLGGGRMRSPEDLLAGLVDPARDAATGKACLGVNIGAWYPPFNTMQTSFHTTAAAGGTVKGTKLAAEVDGDHFYTYSLDNFGDDYNPDNDKVQWTRGKFMDGPHAPGNRICQKVEKWVQDYKDPSNQQKDPNMKRTDPTDLADPADHWDVAVHWRYFRCCVDPESFLVDRNPLVLDNEHFH